MQLVIRNLYYSGGHLARIEDPGAPGATALTDYRYASSGVMTDVHDVGNNDLIRYGTITGTVTQINSPAHMTQFPNYDALGRVTGITAPVPDNAGTPAPMHTYRYASVTQSSVSIAGSGVPTSTALSFDAAGDVATDTDGAGDTTSYRWQGTLLTSITDPSGLETTTIYNAENEATDSYGPAPASTFTGLVSASAPHSTTGYDEGMPGLAATFYDNATLSASAPTQTVHVTGVGDPHGGLDANWGTTPPTGVTTAGWSGRFSGYVTAPTTSSYSFSVTGTGSAAIYLANTLTTTMTLPAGIPVPIRLDYTAPASGGASLGLDWSTGGPATLVPGADLDPGYGLATSQIDADGKKNATAYTGPGVDPADGLATASIVDPGGLNLTTTTIYEPRGTNYFRVSATTLPTGTASTVTDSYYGVTQTSPANRCTPGGDNQAGLLETETGAGANPVVHTYVYDAAGRVVATEVAGDQYWSCTSYDGRGRIASSSDPEGRTTSYDYTNPALTLVRYSDSAGNAKSTSTQVDFDGRQVAYTDELANTSTESYDQASRVTATARGATALTTISYDAASRVSSTADDVGGGSFAFGYNADGNLTTISRPNGVTSYQGYDAATGWLASITSTSASGPLPAAANSSYAYSPAKRISAQSSGGQTSSFGYDPAGRLQSQQVNGVTTTYAYDPDSNRCAVNAGSCNGSYSYNAADEVLASPGASYSYNSRGDVTSTAGASQNIFYDGADHVTETIDAATPTATVVNNEVAPSGRVLQTYRGPLGILGVTDTFFGFDSSSDSPSYTDAGTLSILGQGGIPTPAITDYVAGAGQLLALDALAPLGIGVTPSYPITDAHGDIVGTTNSSGTFTANPPTDAWGVASSAPASNLGYLGNAERYTTGAGLDLIQMGVRLYDPSLGRFLEPDPAPTGSNLYGYADSDPVNASDLSGSICWSCLGKRLVGKAAGLGAKFAAALATLRTQAVDYADEYGNTVLHSDFAKVAGLSDEALGAIGSGVGQGVLDAFNRSLSVGERIGRVALAVAAGTGAAFIAGAVCAGGACEFLVAAAAGFALYKGASFASGKNWLGQAKLTRKKVGSLIVTALAGGAITGTAGLERVSPSNRGLAVAGAVLAALVCGLFVSLAQNRVRRSSLGGRRTYLAVLGAIAGVGLAMAVPEGVATATLLGAATGTVFMAIYWSIRI